MTLIYPVQSPLFAKKLADDRTQVSEPKKMSHQQLLAVQTNLLVTKFPRNSEWALKLDKVASIQTLSITYRGEQLSGFMATPIQPTNKWVLYVPGNKQHPTLFVADKTAQYVNRMGYNLLMLDPVGIYGREGTTTLENFGLTYHLGLRLLEEPLGATTIHGVAYSLGTALLGAAIQRHAFHTTGPNTITYNMYFLAGLNKLSEATKGFIQQKIGAKTKLQRGLGSVLAALPGGASAWACQVDNGPTIDKLQQLHIPTIIVNADGDDGVISKSARLVGDYLCHSSPSFDTLHVAEVAGAKHSDREQFEAAAAKLFSSNPWQTNAVPLSDAEAQSA